LRFKRKAATMPINHNEIIEELEGQIRRSGGRFNEWCVGTASTIQDGRSKIQNGTPDGLLYREAYTTFAAEEVVERLAGFGLQRERDTTHNPAATAHHGKTVFVYRKIPSAHIVPGKEAPTFRKLAA
jgi:hypothetical protein